MLEVSVPEDYVIDYNYSILKKKLLKSHRDNQKVTTNQNCKGLPMEKNASFRKTGCLNM